MPAPRKLDLIPEELRAWLREELAQRGFAEIVEVTDALNARLERGGLEIRVGKTAVGEFSKVLKDQRDAFAIAEAVLAEADIEAEGALHRTLMQMIAASAVHMIKAARDEDGQIKAQDLHFLGRMLKDLMQSAGFREKLLEDDRTRQRREQAAKLDAEVKGGALKGMTADTVEAIKSRILGVSA